MILDEKYESKVKQLKKDYMNVFSGETGQKVLEDLKVRCFHKDTTFVPGDSHATVMNEGARQAILTILNIIELDFDVLIKRRIIDG